MGCDILDAFYHFNCYCDCIYYTKFVIFWCSDCCVSLSLLKFSSWLLRDMYPLYCVGIRPNFEEKKVGVFSDAIYQSGASSVFRKTGSDRKRPIHTFLQTGSSRKNQNGSFLGGEFQVCGAFTVHTHFWNLTPDWSASSSPSGYNFVHSANSHLQIIKVWFTIC